MDELMARGLSQEDEAPPLPNVTDTSSDRSPLPQKSGRDTGGVIIKGKGCKELVTFSHPQSPH